MDPVYSYSKSHFRASEHEVVRMLNGLMNSLHLPIPVLSPTDLTPSLLFAILESLLGQKVPLPPIANHRDKDSSSAMKLQKVKLFLGVLEADILQGDVGLSKIDPRRLAAGEYLETLYVGRVLCMVGLRMGLIPTTSQGVYEKQGERTSPGSRLFGGPRSHATETPTRAISPRPQTPPQCNTSAPLPSKNSGDGSRRLDWRKRRSTSPTRLQPKPLRKTWSDPTTSRFNPQPQPPPSRYPTPELDTTCVFYAPSSTNTRDTHTITSIFDDIGSSDSSATSPEASPQRKGAQASLPAADAPTPSSVALDFEPPFQSPAQPVSTRHADHDPPPSLLFSVEHSAISTPKKKKRPSEVIASPIAVRHTTTNPINPSASTSSFNLHPSKVSIRHSGFIEPVDEASEIASYEHSRSFSISFSPPQNRPLDDSESDSSDDGLILKGLDEDSNSKRKTRRRFDTDKTARTIAAIHEEYERTLKLLDERSKLLQELAELNISR